MPEVSKQRSVKRVCGSGRSCKMVSKMLVIGEKIVLQDVGFTCSDKSPISRGILCGSPCIITLDGREINFQIVMKGKREAEHIQKVSIL